MIDWDEPEPPPIEHLHELAELLHEVRIWRERYEDLLARARHYAQDQELV